MTNTMLYYLWFVALVCCAMGSTATIPGVDALALVGTIILSVAAVGQWIPWQFRIPGTLVTFCLLSAVTVWSLTPLPHTRAIFIDLFLVFLVALPALLRVWTKQLQAAAGLITAATVLMLWSKNPGWYALHSVVIVGASVVLAWLVSQSPNENEPEKEDADAGVGTQLWSAVLLQVGILVIWIFYNAAFARRIETQEAYGVLVVIFTALLLRAGQPVSLTLAAGTVFAGYLTALPNGDILPLVLLSCTTVTLSWGGRAQIGVAWGLTIVWIAGRLAQGMAFSTLLGRYTGELSLLLVGTAATVFLQRILHHGKGAEQRRAMEFDRSFCRAIDRARIELILRGLYWFGIASCGFSSVLLGTPSFWVYAVSGWVVFVAAWLGLSAFFSRTKLGEETHFLCASLAILCFLWPVVVSALLPVAHWSWISVPVLIVVGLAFIPWRMREFLPLIAVAIIATFDVLGRYALRTEEILLFVGSVVLVLTFSRSLRSLERAILPLFEKKLHDSGDAEECVRAFAEAGLELLDLPGCVFSTAPNCVLALRGGQLTEEDPAVLEQEVSYEQVRPGVLRAEAVGMWYALGQNLIVLFPRRFSSRSFFALDTFASATASRLRLIEEQQLALDHARGLELAVAERESELSMVVHDINNTVQDLSLLCDAMLDHAGDLTRDEIVPQIERVTAIARSMATMISDAKRRRELERFQDLSPRESVEVISTLDELVKFAGVRAERKRIRVESDVPRSGEIWVNVSAREHLETILRNLLTNALLYSPSGSSVWVGLSQEPGWVSVCVADNGPGLAPEECESIFRAGMRGRGAVSGGLGVGLAQSRRVAESAGGTLIAESSGLGKGARFTVRLPRQRTGSTKKPHAPWALLVDDQPDLTEFYARLARALNLEPKVAHSIEEAVNVLEREGRPTLVVTDIHLTGQSGLELIEHLRREWGLALPILVVSALTEPETEQKARSLGATDFLKKPIGRQELFARIQSLLLRGEGSGARSR